MAARAAGEIFPNVFPIIPLSQLVWRVRVRDGVLDWNLLKKTHALLRYGARGTTTTTRPRPPGAQGGAPWDVKDIFARIIAGWASSSTVGRVVLLIGALASVAVLVRLMGGGEAEDDDTDRARFIQEVRNYSLRPLEPLDRLGLPFLPRRAVPEPRFAIVRRGAARLPRHRRAAPALTLGLRAWEETWAVAPRTWLPPPQEGTGLGILLEHEA